MKNNVIIGPVLIPNKKVYRQPTITILKPHYIFFTEDTIEKLRTNFHEKNFEGNVNINHDGKVINGIIMTDSYIINNDNKIKVPDEFKDLPNGTWMAEYKIENETIWQMINEKKLNGFSIEGLFNFEYIS